MSQADELGTSRPKGSRIENEVDVRLSTLERYVEAVGGRLEICAVFDNEAVNGADCWSAVGGSSRAVTVR